MLCVIVTELFSIYRLFERELFIKFCVLIHQPCPQSNCRIKYRNVHFDSLQLSSPLALFFNILDLAAINAWIIFRKQIGSKISRRQFLLQLSKELISSQSVERVQSIPSSLSAGKLSQRVTWQIKRNCKRNRTVSTCATCKKRQCVVSVCVVSVCVVTVWCLSIWRMSWLFWTCCWLTLTTFTVMLFP